MAAMVALATLKHFVCETCGNSAVMFKESGEPLVCCGQKMKESVPGKSDGDAGKHVPVFTVDGNNIAVCVGAHKHPSDPNHYIEWIAIETTKGEQRKLLIPGDIPAAEFQLTEDDRIIAVYAYCNMHGLWKGEYKLFSIDLEN